MSKRRSPLWLVLLLSLFAGAPLLAPGYFLHAHDAAHSLFWLTEFDQGIRDGFLWPRWAPDHALGYGYPLFTFYAPLVFYVAEFFHLLGASILGAVKIVWGLGIVLSGLSMYALVRRLWGAGPAVIAALLYVYAPYHLVNIYVRSALAEFVAMGLYPWVVLCFWDVLAQGGRRRVAWAALSFGLLLLTHSVTVVFFPPVLILLILYWLAVQAWRQKRVPWAAILRAAVAGVGGAMLAAIFLLPAVAESRYIVQDQWLPDTYQYGNQFLYPFQWFQNNWGFGFAIEGPDDGMSMQVGLWLFVLGLGTLPLLWQHRPRHLFTWAGFGLLAVGTLWLTQAGSHFLWALLPLMALIQFPFRLLALINFSLALTAAGMIAALTAPAASSQSQQRLSPALLALALAIVFASYPMARPQHTPLTAHSQSPRAVIDFEVNYPDMRGSTAFAKAPPQDSPKLAAYLANEPLPLAGILAGQGTIRPLHHGAGSERIHLSAQSPVTVQFYTYWYPGWQGEIDGQPLPLVAAGPDALITLQAPAGEHEIAIRFRNTPLRSGAAVLSLLSLLIIMIVLSGLDTRIWRRFHASTPADS
ncbi:MAG: hypothetical protein GXP37_10305 [Chloroflexi bacterium]|nr:hypothetical protein [Chloroflexota bacterium]